MAAAGTSSGGAGGEGSGMEAKGRKVNEELWYACAGPLVALPPAGSLVVYFPQGHSEQVRRRFLIKAAVSPPPLPLNTVASPLFPLFFLSFFVSFFSSSLSCRLHLAFAGKKELVEVVCRFMVSLVSSSNWFLSFVRKCLASICLL